MPKLNLLKLILVYYIITQLKFSINCSEVEERRFLQSWINYECNIPECKKINNQTSLELNYVRSSELPSTKINKINSMYHFFSSTYNGTPSFIVVSTNQNSSKLKINYPKLISNDSSNSINFGNKNKSDDTIGFFVNKIFFWNDTSLNGQYQNSSPKIVLNNKDLSWSDVQILENLNTTYYVEFSTKPSKLIYGGSLKIRLMISSFERRNDNFPKLLITPKSFYIKLIIEDIKIDKFKIPRIGLEITIITSGKNVETCESNTFNDEYSPGIFKEYMYVFGQKKFESSFLYLKPNAYNNKKRQITNSVDLKQFQIYLLNNSDILKMSSLINGYYGNNSNFRLWNLTFTFGNKDDDYYSKTNYTEFSFTLGLGKLPENGLSFFIQLIIIFASGLSLIIILVFPVTICIITKKMKLRRNANAALLDQEDIY